MFNVQFKRSGNLERLRGLGDRVARNFRNRIGTEVSPDLQAGVLAIMAESPGVASSPFEFGGELSGVSGYSNNNLSRRFYFWLITSGVFSGATDGKHWIRSGETENSWQTQISFGTFTGKFTLFTKNPAAKYLYGPWQVAGHRNTGWGQQMNNAKTLVFQEAKRAVFDVFVYVARAAVRGSDI